MSDQEKAPKVEFPCEYPIKVVGDAVPDLYDRIIAIMKMHDSVFDESLVTQRPSRNGNYHAVNVVITATGEEQLKSIHEALKAYSAIKFVI